MSKKIIFSLMLFVLFAKSLYAENVAFLNTGTLTTNTTFVTAWIIQREIVEWVTVNKTIPVEGNFTKLLYIPLVLNQVGAKYLVTIAQIEWKGEIKEVELERIIVESESVLERQITYSLINNFYAGELITK